MIEFVQIKGNVGEVEVRLSGSSLEEVSELASKVLAGPARENRLNGSGGKPLILADTLGEAVEITEKKATTKKKAQKNSAKVSAPAEAEPEEVQEAPKDEVSDGVTSLVTAEDFKGVRKRREIVRMIMGKGINELDDIVKVCESLKEEVQLLGYLDDIPPAIKLAYDAVIAEDRA